MTGGGFGGCTVSLVDKDSTDTFCEIMEKTYEEKTGTWPEIYVTMPSAGGTIQELRKQVR